MKIGVISRGSPDYLIDIVTDGLIRLHGRQSVSLDYNVRGGWGGQYSILLKGFQGPEPFDIHEADILVGSVRSLDAISEWIKKTGNKKVAIIDGEDDERLREPWSIEFPYFKREYMRDRPYAKNVKPLPFAAIPENIPDVSEISRDVFFMAHGTNHFRGEVEEAILSMGYEIRKDRIEKLEYNVLLASSLVGISVRGGGWDTYRYWETAYFGTALLSQRLPILIPNDFEEGKEATFFSTAQELKEKLKALVSDPARAMELGKNIRKKCLTFHLSTNRANTVLEAIL